MTHSHAAMHVLRWTARVGSIASLLLVLAFAIGDEGLLAGMITANEWIGIALFPVGVLFGQALAWWREEWGGAVTIGSLLAFYVWNLIASSRLPHGPFFALIAAPGALFLVCWFLSRRTSAG